MLLTLDGAKILEGSKVLQKQSFASGHVQVTFTSESESEFVLSLGSGSKRRELSLLGSSRQQRDMLLLALCAFSRKGWLEAALGGRPPPIALPSTASASVAAAPSAAVDAADTTSGGSIADSASDATEDSSASATKKSRAWGKSRLANLLRR